MQNGLDHRTYSHLEVVMHEKIFNSRNNCRVLRSTIMIKTSTRKIKNQQKLAEDQPIEIECTFSITITATTTTMLSMMEALMINSILYIRLIPVHSLRMFINASIDKPYTNKKPKLRDNSATQNIKNLQPSSNQNIFKHPNPCRNRDLISQIVVKYQMTNRKALA